MNTYFNRYDIIHKMKYKQIGLFPECSKVEHITQVVSEPRVLPFIKWAGGKRNLVTKITQLMPDRISGYHEPFLGGGAIFFGIEHRIEKATLADLNKNLILTYKVIANDVDSLIECLLKHKQNHHQDEGYYLKVRSQHNLENPIDIASRFIYLNKTCFNGLYRVNKKGEFNVPRGNYKDPKICDPVNLLNVSNALKKADIYMGQFDETISPGPNDFVYCDPPYDGTFTLYQSKGFKDEDQKRLKYCMDMWTHQGVFVMVSNSDTPYIRELYKSYNIHAITANGVISSKGSSRGQTPELLILNYEDNCIIR